MPFIYNPPTRTQCTVCDTLHQENLDEPLIQTTNGKSTSANNFSFHNWYNFVLGYSPQFPEYMLHRENITQNDLVVDPFAGSGTTLIACKILGIPSMGVDANDFMVDAAGTKLNWCINLEDLKRYRDEILRHAEKEINTYRWSVEECRLHQSSFFDTSNQGKKDYITYVQKKRPEMLVQKYISDMPFAKASIIDEVIQATFDNNPLKAIFDLALTSIIVPISNIKYGPGFGVIKPKIDSDVLKIFSSKLSKMIRDLETVNDKQRSTLARITLGDSRHLCDYLEPNSANLMITSPPYPGDHEYTKHTRLELIFKGYATSVSDFRVIKKRMLRASTTNLYNDDNDRKPIADLQSIRDITNVIQERLEHDKATSGFEKLYTKVVWEYFGGMYKTLAECFRVLKPGGKIALLVSDSHAFKMVHIQTASILQEIGERVGFVTPEIVLWQLKSSTSHKYNLRENILILSKP